MIPFRTGIGVDVHQLAEGAEMHCAGLYFPDEPRGLAGHSDGDVACHAVSDARADAQLGEVGLLACLCPCDRILLARQRGLGLA